MAGQIGKLSKAYPSKMAYINIWSSDDELHSKNLNFSALIN